MEQLVMLVPLVGLILAIRAWKDTMEQVDRYLDLKEKESKK